MSGWANGLFATDWNFWKVGMEGNPWEGWLSEEVFHGQKSGVPELSEKVMAGEVQ